MSLWIDVDRFLDELRQVVGGLFENKFPRRRQITIEIDRADERFERVGQRRVAQPPAARFFAAPHHQVMPEIDGGGVQGQRFAGNEARSELG